MKATMEAPNANNSRIFDESQIKTRFNINN
jgi:hypothetical protein